MENEKRLYEFQKLTPYEKADMEGYDQSLNFVFQKGNEDLRNIAITGNFGSGKSSVIRSYAENHKDLSFIYVSLAHFEGVSGETDKENYDVNIEEKIINHLVQQIPLKNVPDSGYRIKRTFNKWGGIWLATRIAVLFCIMAYLNSWTTMHELQNSEIWSWITGSIATASILCIGFADTVSLIYSIVKSLNTRKKIKSLKLQNGTLEFSDQSEKSYFDQHLDEILYLLSEAKVDAIVFEDIDRFEEIDLKVLEHLRELCTLSNDRIRNIDAKRKPIRFIYLIGDHVFEQHTDRTKFFDYMIPVIPVVDASNSYAKMREFFEKSGDYEKLSDRFIRGLCLYLDDLRTIKNIVNEFQIYNSKLSRTAKDSNQLLALIVYKNIYPDDFSDLQQGRGYLYGVLSKKTSISEMEIKRVETEIDELKKKLESIDKETLISAAELEAVNKERQNYPNRFKDYSYNEWINRVYQIRSESIKARSDNDSQKIRASIVEKQKVLTHIRNRHLSDLINDSNEAIVFGYKKINDKVAEDTSLRDKNDNQLVEFFIKNGFIDETTYRDYIALFYEKGMSYKDKDFLIAVNSHNGKPFDYEIQDLDLVIENLDSDDFIQPESRNFSISDYLLEHNMDEYVQKFVFQLQENTDYEYIAQYLRVTKNKLSFIKALNKFWTGAMVALVSNDNQVMTLEEIQDYLVCSLAHIGTDALKVQNQDDLITLYITDKFADASCGAADCDAIGDSLITLGVKFADIDKQLKSDDLRGAVYVRDLYILNRNNVESILKSEYELSSEKIKDRELTAVFSDSEQALAGYVDKNISEFITGIVVENSEIHDDLDVAVGVLNNEKISGELKEQYISLLSESFESLEGIEEGQWQTILMHDKVICNSGEILRFFKKYGLTDELVEFINKNDDIDYASYEDEGTLKKFFDASVKNKNLNNDRYREIVQQIGNQLVSFNIPGLGDEKLIVLVEENLIPMNLSNLQFIRQNYPNEISIFVEGDVNGYLGLIQGNNLMPNEVLLLIGNQRIDVESRQKLAAQMPTPISLNGRDYDDEMIIYILSKKYDANDMPYLIEKYRDFSTDVQEAVYKKLNGQIAVIKNNISVIASDKELLWRIFEDKNISVSEKSNLIDLLITKGSDVDLQFLLQKMGFSNMTKLVSGDTSRLPQIKNGAEEKAILSVLKKHGYVENYNVDDDGDTIKVERKKTLFGGKHGR